MTSAFPLRKKSRFNFKLPGRAVRLVALLLLLGLSGYVLYLDITICEAFEGRKFALPARVYGRALEVYPGLKRTRGQFVGDMKSIGYHENPQPDEAATYKNTLSGIEFTTRDFVFGDGTQPSQHLRIEFAVGKVSLLQQGGSTLTQQLVKNFFLTPERTLTRKANEALMALLLELHYSKGEILETYLNEIFLGQDANRAIHGFGLASYFYFDRPLDRLGPQEIATLVGMVKGPTVY